MISGYTVSANLRYVIRSISHAAEMRGVPLVYGPVELRVLPVSDIAYLVPMDQRDEQAYESSSECVADSQQGWRQGITHDEVW